MVKRLLSSTLCKLSALFLVLMASSTSLAQPPQLGLSAFVDRTDITQNDVITLTIRVDSELGSIRPNFNGLGQDFEQLGISSINSYTNTNGNVQSWNEYRVELKPIVAGTLTIPSFRVGAQVTTPIVINVAEAPITASSLNNEIFINTELSKSSVYVQEQLLYTIKLYYTIGFDQGAQLSSPVVADAVVQQLGSDETFQEIIDGLRYNVTERKFVIFPQRSGEMTISPITFNASIGRRGGLSRILSNRSNIREVNLTSDAHEINVKGVPSSFSGTTWLPTSNFNIEENWNAALDQITVGESITRNLLVSAAGLSSSLLPEFEQAEMPNLKFYPDQPVREDLADANGVLGRRSEGTAIVPAVVGEYILPAIEVPWWNTVTDRQETAVIPARTIMAIASLLNPVDPSTQTNLTQTPLPLPLGEASSPSIQTRAVGTYWIIATGLFALAWLFSTMMWLRHRRMLDHIESPEYAAALPVDSYKAKETIKIKTETQLANEKTAFGVLKRACEKGHLTHIRRSLLSWGQAYFQNPGLITLEALNQSAQSPELAKLLVSLEQSLYSEGNSSEDFPSKILLAEVNNVQKNKTRKNSNQTDYSLPPLYKN